VSEGINNYLPAINDCSIVNMHVDLVPVFTDFQHGHLNTKKDVNNPFQRNKLQSEKKNPSLFETDQ
jgi:hypothetical protein